MQNILSRSYSKTYKLLILIISIIFLSIISATIVPYISDIFTNVLRKASSGKGGQFESLIILISPLILIIWIYLVFIKKDYFRALLFQIIIFPLTYKAEKAFAIIAYTYHAVDRDVSQEISLTTFLIIGLFFIMFLNKKLKRPQSKEWRTFEKLIISYATILTITQFFNHSIYSAIWLSIGGIWQFVFIFYILSSVLTSYDKVLLLLRSLIIFTFINIIMRVFSEEQVIVQGLASEVIRVGAGAMGPAVSYGGYLTIIITITICLHRYTKNWLYVVVALLLFVELLNTFTRGAFLTLLFLILIILWKKERKYFYRLLLLLLPFLILFGNKIWEFISHRGFFLSLKILELSGVNNRLWLLKNYFTKAFNFSLIGNGIGNLTHVQTPFIRPLTPHNIIVALLDQTGIIVTILFIVAFIYSLLLAIKISKNKYMNSNILSIFLSIALIQWFFFANTTSTLLNWSYPYEASSIFWIILFLPSIVSHLKVSYSRENYFQNFKNL